MTNKNFVVAKVYILITSIVLTAMYFVPCNSSINGELFALSSFIVEVPFSEFWSIEMLPGVYFGVAVFSIIVIVTGLLLMLIKSAKIFRIMAFGTFIIASMLFAFSVGSEINAIGHARVLYSYAAIALILTVWAAIFSVRVTIYEKSEIEKANE